MHKALVNLFMFKSSKFCARSSGDDSEIRWPKFSAGVATNLPDRLVEINVSFEKTLCCIILVINVF